MAQYNPTVALGQIKGSIGSTTFQQGNLASVIRHKGYKKGKSSAKKSKATSNLALVTTTWKTLTAGERRTWISAALLWSFTNKWGISYFGSAYQCFTAYNSNLLSLNDSIVTTPNTPETPESLGTITIRALTTTSFIIEWTIAPALEDLILFFASNSMSAGRNNNNAKVLFCGGTDARGVTSIDIFIPYSNTFGPPVLGQKIVLTTYQTRHAYPYKYFKTTLSEIVT